MSYFPPTINKTTYRRMITNSDLSGGSVTITHRLDEDFPIVIVYNNEREVVIPDGVLSLDENTIYLVLNSFGNIVGNWCVALGK